MSGHLDEGQAILRGVLEQVGMSLPRTRFGGLVSLIAHRLRIRLRGLGYRERRAGEVPESLLEKIDVSWSVAAGLATKDPIIAPAFQSRNLLLALRAGEPLRLVRALAWEAAHDANGGIATREPDRRAPPGREGCCPALRRAVRPRLHRAVRQRPRLPRAPLEGRGRARRAGRDDLPRAMHRRRLGARPGQHVHALVHVVDGRICRDDPPRGPHPRGGREEGRPLHRGQPRRLYPAARPARGWRAPTSRFA